MDYSFIAEFAILGLLSYIIKMFKDHQKEHKLLEKATRDQMRNTLLDLHGKAMKYGDMSIQKREAFYALYESYSALGGNGFVENLKKDIDDNF